MKKVTASRKELIFKNTLSNINFKLTILKNAIVVLFGTAVLLLIWLIVLTLA